MSLKTKEKEEPGATSALRRPMAAQQTMPAAVAAADGGTPVVPEYVQPVITLFVRSMADDLRKTCVLEDGTSWPAKPVDQDKFLRAFVRQKLDRIARKEYAMWLNGRLPYISPREIQVWRLRQFAQNIWDWNLPDDEDVAILFNLTKRQATSLLSDFHAKFRKEHLYPRILRRVLDLLIHGKPQMKDASVGTSIGVVFWVPSKRYVTELNSMIQELRNMNRKGKLLRAATSWERNDQLMWVSQEVMDLVGDSSVQFELLNLHPISQDNE